MTLSRFVVIVLSVACLAWLGWAAYTCWHDWPRIPLDISATDPATISAHRKAVFSHIATYAFLGLCPAAILLIVTRRFKRAQE
ncbi:MAG: hypothetical protein ACRBCJ_03065 [Hyphomicrobiaceae bacterium]